MLKKRFTKALVAVGCAAVFALAALLGVFYHPDQMLADGLYQSPKALDGNIFVVGIDDRAIDDIGPYQTWGRDVIAMAIEALNADPENRPAAIGIDVLYIGETEPELDAWLAEAAGECGNVVVASVANFGTELVTEDTGNFYLEDYSILSYEEPYEALRAVTSQGHINAMYDEDGILRHGTRNTPRPTACHRSSTSPPTRCTASTSISPPCQAAITTAFPSPTCWRANSPPSSSRTPSCS